MPASIRDVNEIRIESIGHVVSGYARPQDTPPQSTENASEPGRVVVYERYRAGLSGLEEYPHIWLVTWLHAQRDEDAARLRVVPRGLSHTGERRGVFATRAPGRPSRLGMSLVRLVALVDDGLHFQGVDLVDGTPVLDIKPWVPDTDMPPG